MKSLTTLLLIFCFIGNSCKKKEEDPEPKNTKSPELTLSFGYLGGFSFYDYIDQSNVSVDSLLFYNNLGISILESNIDASNPLEFEDVRFNFNLTTGDDNEAFIDKQNIYSTAKSMTEFGNLRFIDGQFSVPIKIGSPAVVGNDTLEISGVGDNILMQYTSIHSSLTGTKTLKVVQ